MGRLTKIAVLLAALLAAAPPAHASDILIVGNEAKVPKIYKENGQAKGILIEIVRAVDRELEGHAFTYQLFPWARAYNMAEQGKAGIIGLSMTAQRLEIFDYSDVLYFDEVIVVVKRGKEFPFAGVGDLRGKVVGIGRRGTFGGEFDQAAKAGLFKVEEDDGDVPRLKKLLAGRIDCALISPGPYALNQVVSGDRDLLVARDAFVALPQPLARDPNYLGFAKSMRMRYFLDEFNAALRRCRQRGEIQRIVDTHP